MELGKDDLGFEVKADDKENVRIVFDVPAGKALVELIERPGLPPYVVVLARADMTIAALGCLAKASHLVNLAEAEFSTKFKLAQGVTK